MCEYDLNSFVEPSVFQAISVLTTNVASDIINEPKSSRSLFRKCFQIMSTGIRENSPIRTFPMKILNLIRLATILLGMWNCESWIFNNLINLFVRYRLTEVIISMGYECACLVNRIYSLHEILSPSIRGRLVTLGAMTLLVMEKRTRCRYIINNFHLFH